MNYRLVHDNKKVVTILEATGTTCCNGCEIVDGSLQDIYDLISSLDLTNSIPMSAFQQ